MGVIINIDEALKLRTHYNVLREPLNQLLQSQQEAWERQNPIDLLFTRSTIDRFQETYTSNIGFDHAFAETSDYAVAPIFNQAEGFSATYRTRTFQGGFIITQQTLEDGETGKVRDDATQFMRRWHGDIVEYAMTALQGAFGKEVTWGSEANGGISRMQLFSADTVDGDVNAVKNPLFTNKHTVVKRPGMTAADVTAKHQSNLFHAKIDLGGNDPGKIAKLADLINQVITIQENYLDDNGKIAGVNGAKSIVAPNSAHLKAALNTALSTDSFNNMGQMTGINPAYQRATADTTPYLNMIECCKDGKGFFIVDRAYNAANHGPEFTERIPLTLDVIEEKRPRGIIYDGRQRFDVNAASWRGIAFVYIGDLDGANAPTWVDKQNFTEITLSETIVKPVTVVGEVATKA